MKRTHTQRKIEHFTAGVLAIAGCFLMVTFPKITRSGVESGLELFTGSIFPTMFPFFILANFLGTTEVPARIGRLFEPIFQRVFRVDGRGAYVAVISLFSGYPMAAKLVGDFCRDGSITPLEGKKILSFSSFCGPLFMVGVVGTAMLGKPLYGGMIAAGHYLAAILNGVLFCRYIYPSATACGGSVSRKEISKNQDSLSVFTALSQAILRGFSSMGLICGYILLCSVLAEFLTEGLVLWLPHWEWMQIILRGVLEFSTGCQTIADASELSLLLRMSLCSCILTFGGLSIMGQSLSMLSDTGIEAREYLFIKLCHGCLAGILTYYLGLAAESFGILDLTVGMIYGSDVPWIRQLGKIHQRVYTAGSMIVVLILMAILVALDHFIHGSYHKVHTYIIERRKNDQ